ncbi:hypothetical protein VC83_08908 [Pseudogymnoascus destructans]|uniref:Uncharacterized protein n=1 Tax=Pseudogymnoascus destructans TaxID=655981 RepID=A0A176ZZW9_9PEZI|nr:uncharacterized protein VC83_08908 [Pseudogymnoascus destructans]OAF54782.2 hypothetical protein VC83_08908 [Pseudogymnoascus destructans]
MDRLAHPPPPHRPLPLPHNLLHPPLPPPPPHRLHRPKHPHRRLLPPPSSSSTPLTLSRRSSQPLLRSPVAARNKADQTAAYWNEYDYPSDGGGAEEPYIIAFDADDGGFPGQQRMAKALAYLSEKTTVLGWWRPSSSSGESSSKGERRALLGSSSRTSDLETGEDEDVDDYDADGFPLGYETHYATFPSIATQRLTAQRSRLLLLALVVCYTSSALLLGIGGILVATGRNRLRAEVDAGVIAGVVAALGFVGVGVRVGALRWEAAGVWERVGVVVGFVAGWNNFSGPHKSLRRARGMEVFALYIAGWEKLETFEIVGTDYVNEAVDGAEAWVQVDVNHPLAVGSWPREKMAMGKKEREIFGKEVIERERRERRGRKQ